MKLFDKIPYHVRKENDSHLTTKDVENALSDAFSESFVSQNEMVSVYVDNKYHPLKIEVTTYKDIKPEKNNITVPYKDFKDQFDDDVQIIVYFVEGEEVRNTIKEVCSELKISPKELADKLGIKESSVRNMSSSGNITTQVKKTLDLLIQVNNLESQLKDYHTLRDALKNLTK